MSQPEETVSEPLIPKPKRKVNALLLEVFGASAVLQIGLLILAGGYIVYESVIKDDVQFDEPPPERVEEPPPENVEIQIQRQPPRMNMTQRSLKIKSVGNISVASVASEVITGNESFTIASGEVGGVGNLSIGGGASRLGLGMSEINVFGLKDTGERILFLIDADRDMLSDNRGGLWSYQAIKDEVARLCGSLAPGTLFNVIMFEQTRGRAQTFQPNLVSATPTNVDKLTTWLQSFNVSKDKVGVPKPNIGITQNTDTEIGAALKATTWRSGRFKIAQIALEHNIDLVYIITSEWAGFDRLRRLLTPEERAAWNRKVNSPEYQEQMRLHREERKINDPIVERKKEALDKQRASRGLPPKIWRHGYWEGYRDALREFGMKEKHPHPGHEPVHHVDERAVTRYFKDIVKKLYIDKKLREPKFNVILFIAEDEEVDADKKKRLREFTRFFRNGRYRELKGAKAIKANQSRLQGENV